MGPSWKEMFPWGSWAADNPGRIGIPRLILKGPWRFDPENGLWGGSYQMHRYVNVKNGGTWSGWGLITVA